MDVKEVVGSRVEKKEEVVGKMGWVGGLVEAEEVIDWIEDSSSIVGGSSFAVFQGESDILVLFV